MAELDGTHVDSASYTGGLTPQLCTMADVKDVKDAPLCHNHMFPLNELVMLFSIAEEANLFGVFFGGMHSNRILVSYYHMSNYCC